MIGLVVRHVCHERLWLVNEIRTDIAMKGIKLNARVLLTKLFKNLQHMHENPLPPTGAQGGWSCQYRDRARLQGRGPHPQVDTATA